MNLKSKSRILGTAAAVAGAALFLAGCGAPGESGGGSGGGDASGPIKVALITPISGNLASIGDWEKKGVELAINEQNENGGIDGRQIELTIYDDTGDPTTATNLATKAVSDGNIFIFGSASSGTSLAMVPILTDAEVPMMSSGQSAKLPDSHSPFLFLNTPSSPVFDETLAEFLVVDQGYTKIAMISNNGTYGAGEQLAFNEALASRGVTAVADQTVDAKQTDFSGALAAIQATNPEVLFIGAEEVQSGLIAKQARQLGIDALLAGGAPMGTPVYQENGGLENVVGSITANTYFGNDTNDETRAFGEAYAAAYNGEEAEAHGAKAYDGAKIVISALLENPTATGADLAEAIRGIHYVGLGGTFDFDEDGLGIHEVVIGVVEADGSVVPFD